MKAAAIRREETGVFESTGTVTAIGEGTFDVRVGQGYYAARRAVSCLVAPELGDLVLLAGPTSRDLYVLAVLERTSGPHARIKSDGDLTVELRSGHFTIAAAEGVDLVSSKSLSFAADRILARAREGSLLVSSMTVIAEAVDSTLERLSQTIKRAYRRVMDLDQLRAGHIDYAADGNVRLHGENTLITARELVKSDAKQIHLG
jgi:hypothetical protein